MLLRKLAFTFILFTLLLTFALVLAGQGAAQVATATPTPTIHIGFGCIAGCTPVVVPTHLMPTSAPTPEPLGAVRVRVYLPFVVR